ncbi:MAG: serine hydrolase [Ferruginibacter sp.]|nr:serine hydrolase [Ferruginibacter sp.]
MSPNKQVVIYFIIFLYASLSCNTPKKAQTMDNKPAQNTTIPEVDNSKTDVFLADVLNKYPQYFQNIIQNKKNNNVQIIYSSINRGKNGVVTFKNYHYNVNANRYFYPASTIKFPVAILALQRLNELKQKGIDANTTMLTETATPMQTAVYNDATTPNGKPTIAHYIKKILMVSDNDAYNRLYEFLGQEYINKELQKRGYTNVQIVHRLSIALPEEENRKTNPIRFLDSNNNVLYEQAMQNSKMVYAKRSDSLGKGYMASNGLMPKPMDFSKKNRISLEELHSIMQSIIFPESVTATKRFNITEEDRQFLLKYMSQLPTESAYPPYSDEPQNYWPAYCKFLFFGSEKGEWPQNMRVFNKVGDAYGHLIDVAYIVDFEKGVEFMLSAVIYCNSDDILNDDKYDYDKVGFPFMKNLGKIIYEEEIKRRQKSVQPDLSSFKFVY